MTMPARHGIYRACIGLYPKAFRLHYGEDLVQHFDDLVVGRGRRRACLRTGLDLAITVPTYRLERIMSQQHSATALVAIVTLVAAAGVVSLLTGVYPGLLLVGVAAVLAVAQRSTLAKAVRTPVAGLRRRRLTISAGLGAVFVACFVAYLALIGDTWTTRETVLACIGNVALVGSLVTLVVGLLTPKADPPLAA